MKLDPFNIVTTALALALLAYAFTGKARASDFTTSAPKADTLGPVLNSMVLQNTFDSAVSAPTDKRGFVTPKFCEVVFRHPIMVMGGMAEAVTPGAWLNPCFEHPARPTRFKTRKADYLIHSGIQTMNPTFTPAQAAPTASTHEAALIQLHAAAHNASTMASWYTKRKQYPQAARKTRQHLAALRDLAKLQEGAAQ